MVRGAPVAGAASSAVLVGTGVVAALAAGFSTGISGAALAFGLGVGVGVGAGALSSTSEPDLRG